ncbi:uncharacterized protein BDR25DRAFT_359415 [Lindgomyces ingoldianus]|uniref:Uncharacterized protein n=1 Tax=Lindgomyces ingoldianus TaxID=673940 RepID=A0ACB6QHN8_9PLEO|nr:uncharacterized protein BDR25DRAFT_359415 [Lindgomyces ingoldianus]KAF2466529.1 hypothetical protein BDR25DRAFT_359415 [Lindgomyces ingoldianus]
METLCKLNRLNRLYIYGSFDGSNGPPKRDCSIKITFGVRIDRFINKKQPYNISSFPVQERKAEESVSREGIVSWLNTHHLRSTYILSILYDISMMISCCKSVFLATNAGSLTSALRAVSAYHHPSCDKYVHLGFFPDVKQFCKPDPTTRQEPLHKLVPYAARISSDMDIRRYIDNGGGLRALEYANCLSRKWDSGVNISRISALLNLFDSHGLFENILKNTIFRWTVLVILYIGSYMADLMGCLTADHGYTCTYPPATTRKAPLYGPTNTRVTLRNHGLYIEGQVVEIGELRYCKQIMISSKAERGAHLR